MSTYIHTELFINYSEESKVDFKLSTNGKSEKKKNENEKKVEGREERHYNWERRECI